MSSISTEVAASNTDRGVEKRDSFTTHSNPNDNSNPQQGTGNEGSRGESTPPLPPENNILQQVQSMTAPTAAAPDTTATTTNGEGSPSGSVAAAGWFEAAAAAATPNGADVPTTTSNTQRDERKLFVGGLPQDITEDEFENFFAQFGLLEDSVVMFDRETRRSRGFGFVTFRDIEVTKKLLQTMGGDPPMPGRLLMRGKLCEVKPAQPKENSRGHVNRFGRGGGGPPHSSFRRSGSGSVGAGAPTVPGAGSRGMAAATPNLWPTPNHHHQHLHHPGYNNMYHPHPVVPNPHAMMYGHGQLPPHQQPQYGAALPPNMMDNNYNSWPNVIPGTAPGVAAAAYGHSMYYPPNVPTAPHHAPPPAMGATAAGVPATAPPAYLDPTMNLVQVQPPPFYNTYDSSTGFAAAAPPIYASPAAGAPPSTIGGGTPVAPMMMGGTSSAMHPVAPGLPLNGAAAAEHHQQPNGINDNNNNLSSPGQTN